jgi:hypothetical protein
MSEARYTDEDLQNAVNQAIRTVVGELGIQTPAMSQAEKYMKAAKDIAGDDPYAEAEILKAFRAANQNIQQHQRKQSQAGLRKEYQERLQAIPRGSIPAITALQKEFRAKGLDV